MMRILVGLFPNHVMQRDRRGVATVVAAVSSLRGFAKPKRVGLARGGRFAVRLPG